MSVAVAEIGTKPDTVEFAVGALRDTVGGVVSEPPEAAASSKLASSTVKFPFEPSVNPKTRPLIPAGITLVTKLACVQVEEAGKAGLESQKRTCHWLSRVKSVKKTGWSDLYHSVIR